MRAKENIFSEKNNFFLIFFDFYCLSNMYYSDLQQDNELKYFSHFTKVFFEWIVKIFLLAKKKNETWMIAMERLAKNATI